MELIFYNLRVICIYNFLEGLFFIIGLNLCLNIKNKIDIILQGFSVGILLYFAEILHEIIIQQTHSLVIQNLFTILAYVIFWLIIYIIYFIYYHPRDKKLFSIVLIGLFVLYNIIINIGISIICYSFKKELLDLIQTTKGELTLQLGTKIFQYFSLLIIYIFRRHYNEQTKQSTSQCSKQ